MRIDTARNELAAIAALINLVTAEIEDLYVLAYDRSTAVAERVAGGSRDYALDTHGDPRVRAAYQQFTEHAVELFQDFAVHAHQLLNHLRAGSSPTPRTRRTISALEHAEALQAAARRAARGEYTPVRRHPQPERDQALRIAEREAKKLSAQVADLERKVRDVTAERDALRARRRGA